jgi:hypothetical protein
MGEQHANGWRVSRHRLVADVTVGVIANPMSGRDIRRLVRPNDRPHVDSRPLRTPTPAPDLLGARSICARAGRCVVGDEQAIWRAVNGELAQAVALAAHGNAWLADVGTAREDIANFEATNSTFQFVRSVRFEVNSRWRGASEVGSAGEWLRSIARTGVHQLSLVAGGSKPIAFANEGSWGVVGRGRHRADAWRGRWEVNKAGVDPADLKPRIWEVSYQRERGNGPFTLEPVDIDGRLEQLRHALAEAKEFAGRDDFLATFVPWFDEALALESGDEPDTAWHPDMLPTVGYGLDARRLLAMGSRSWVFGGMGSWNDIGFNDAATQDQYRQVSERLYRAVLDAIRDATNSFEAVS